MKHIDIIPNYSGITEMIKDGQISPNFLVKSENDGKIHFSNAAGYQVLADGNLYNMYINTTGELKADIYSEGGFSFQILKDGQPITADLDAIGITYACGSQYEDTESQTGVTTFDFAWDRDTTWEIRYFRNENLVQALGYYNLTDEECCDKAGGTWDPDTQTCIMPTCEEQGLCGEYPDCYSCDPSGDDSGDDCGGDPECECYQQGEGWSWNGEECIYTDPNESGQDESE